VNRAGRDEREIAANGAQSAASSGSASTAAGGGDARLSPADTRGGAPAAQRAEAPSGVLGLWRRFGVPVAVGADIVALAAIAIIQARHTHEELTARPELLELPAGPRVLVMPFENLSDDEALDYFADGITEEIMLNLGAFDLFVIP